MAFYAWRDVLRDLATVEEADCEHAVPQRARPHLRVTVPALAPGGLAERVLVHFKHLVVG